MRSWCPSLVWSGVLLRGEAILHTNYALLAGVVRGPYGALTSCVEQALAQLINQPGQLSIVNKDILQFDPRPLLRSQMGSLSTVKFAIIGTGFVGPRHGDAILAVPEAELACIVDPNPAARTVADRLKCPLFSSIQEMLASISKPDAALVCTPNHTHLPISRELLQAGVHVLCEKPISTDVASAQELVIRILPRSLTASNLPIGRVRESQ